MTSMLFGTAKSSRKEIVFDVTGSVRVPTLRRGRFKLMGDALYNMKSDPYETKDVSSEHPNVIRRLTARLNAVGEERPPLGDKPLLMDPPLPYVDGFNEQDEIPEWLSTKVDEIRSKQPTEWAPGETPWPKAPKGVTASKMDGLKDESTSGK